MEAMSFAIRHVRTLADLQQVWSFAGPILDLPTGKHTLEYYTEQFARFPQLLVFAEQHGKVCGCILASVDGDHVLVGPVAVAAESRRQGIGAAMMKEVEKQALLVGHSGLVLGSQEDAEPFYLSCGFQPNLFVQSPDPDCLERLKSLNQKYEVIWATEQEGRAKLMLRTPEIDKPLQRRYEQEFPGCYTQYVFTKQIR